jgi:hypothetical protein
MHAPSNPARISARPPPLRGSLDDSDVDLAVRRVLRMSLGSFEFMPPPGEKKTLSGREYSAAADRADTIGVAGSPRSRPESRSASTFRRGNRTRAELEDVRAIAQTFEPPRLPSVVVPRPIRYSDDSSRACFASAAAR